ncbi:MAG: glycine cleavage system protein GcvH [Gemmatimonadota bacterium]|jgi:glycine cleavage system H protein|nr:glycine cleavage system protein GcvH [Gemmatimonadota bacterium]MDP6802326.1 glycine cleavage system protein GcvH [Gemmatimonadota bacterium]MDP7031940.1 glycine cleavage system protein GcvH [Gemmatimonadota bacterium]
MNIPGELRYTKDHEWVLMEDGVVVLGLTDFAQQELGDIVYVELPELGTQMEVGVVFGSVESVKSVSDLFAPLNGVVVDMNTRLADTPETVNEDPYGEGWLLRAEPSAEWKMEDLLSAEEYADHIGA